uniref:Fatty-acid desaturase n=1 Tax=Sciadococcus taiwanensis TaxID=3028030 RepID=A0A9Y1I229_9RHOD|nr:fatty-acid desaturase [Sciadococcus taiwanensis]
MQNQQKSTILEQKFLGPPTEFLNPTLLLLIFSITSINFSIFGYYYFSFPDVVCFLINVMSLHCAGTVIHDASHRTAHYNKLINALAGHISAMLLGFSFPVFTRVHMQHHAHVNDSENDPDHFVSTAGPLWLIAARFFYHEVYFFQRKLWRKHELLEWLFGRLAVFIVVILGFQFNFLDFILKFWFCPALIVGLALGLFFDYLPHRPFKSKDKWKNARVYPNPVLNFLIFGQNYHLIHHLWPSIPWYNYQKVYYLTTDILDEHESPQTLDIFSSRNLLDFLYDIIIGIKIT